MAHPHSSHALGVIASDFMTKQGGSHKNWKKRLFVLYTDGILKYYVSEKDFKKDNFKGSIDLTEAKAVTISEDPTVPPNSIEIHTPKRTYIICPGSDILVHKWYGMLSRYNYNCR